MDELPVQLHVADPDPFEPHDWLSAWYLRMQRAGADVEVYRYPGAGHLYTDPELPDYDEEAAERTWRIALGFLATLQAGPVRWLPAAGAAGSLAVSPPGRRSSCPSSAAPGPR